MLYLSSKIQIPRPLIKVGINCFFKPLKDFDMNPLIEGQILHHYYSRNVFLSINPKLSIEDASP